MNHTGEPRAAIFSHARVRGTPHVNPHEGAFHGSSPRVRGTQDRILLTKTSTGSSPRVRGTPKVISLKEFPLRFIPACAGNAGLPLLSIKPGTVHPRVCGERRRWMANHHSRCGSSPRVRGTHSAAAKFSQEDGSSPRVRGTRSGIQVPVACGRFIPACAGNAAWRQCTAYNASGSSPRVRGTLLDKFNKYSATRFIPACAGNACTRSTRPTTCPVHPRVCGERGCGCTVSSST